MKVMTWRQIIRERVFVHDIHIYMKWYSHHGIYGVWTCSNIWDISHLRANTFEELSELGDQLSASKEGGQESTLYPVEGKSCLNHITRKINFIPHSLTVSSFYVISRINQCFSSWDVCVTICYNRRENQNTIVQYCVPCTQFSSFYIPSSPVFPCSVCFSFYSSSFKADLP